MADINFSIATLFEKVFGYHTQAFEPEFSTLPTRIENGAQGSPYYDVDAFGNEYYLPVKVTYPDESGNSGTLKDMWLPYPIIGMQCRKKIIDTDLTERRGPVSELINICGWEINIKGFLISRTNDFPEADFTALVRLFEINKVIRISNPVTDIVLLRPDRSGSDEVTIRDFRFPEVRGVKNVRAYELFLISNEPFNLLDIS